MKNEIFSVFLALTVLTSGCIETIESDETPAETVENYFEALNDGQDIEEINSRAIADSSFYFEDSQTDAVQETDVNITEVEQKDVNEVIEDVELFEDSVLTAQEQIHELDIEEYEIVYARTEIDPSNITYLQALTFVDDAGQYYVLVEHEDRWKIIFSNKFDSLTQK